MIYGDDGLPFIPPLVRYAYIDGAQAALSGADQQPPVFMTRHGAAWSHAWGAARRWNAKSSVLQSYSYMDGVHAAFSNAGRVPPACTVPPLRSAWLRGWDAANGFKRRTMVRRGTA